MTKTFIPFDLEYAINKSNGITNAKEVCWGSLMQYIATGTIGGIAGLCALFGINFQALYTDLAMLGGSAYAVTTIANMVAIKIFEAKDTKRACLVLEKYLLDKLKEIDVTTNLECLRQAVVIDRQFKLVRTVHKCIAIPNIDGMGETSIHQEHKIGSKIYELSVGNPTKSLKLDFAFSNSI